MIDNHDVIIVLDSINRGGYRLTTFEIKIPFHCLRELSKHKTLVTTTKSNNNRRKFILNEVAKDLCKDIGNATKNSSDQHFRELWNAAGMVAIQLSDAIYKLEENKYQGFSNKVIEPFASATTVVTATDYSYFFRSRIDHCKNENDPLKIIAIKMKKKLEDNIPVYSIKHVPYIYEEEQCLFDEKQIFLASAGRISRYFKTVCQQQTETEYSQKDIIENDIRLGQTLLDMGHISPFEHIGLSPTWINYMKELFLVNKNIIKKGKADSRFGTFNGWMQYRKLIKV